MTRTVLLKLRAPVWERRQARRWQGRMLVAGVLGDPVGVGCCAVGRRARPLHPRHSAAVIRPIRCRRLSGCAQCARWGSGVRARTQLSWRCWCWRAQRSCRRGAGGSVAASAPSKKVGAWACCIIGVRACTTAGERTMADAGTVLFGGMSNQSKRRSGDDMSAERWIGRLSSSSSPPRGRGDDASSMRPSLLDLLAPARDENPV